MELRFQNRDGSEAQLYVTLDGEPLGSVLSRLVYDLNARQEVAKQTQRQAEREVAIKEMVTAAQKLSRCL